MTANAGEILTSHPFPSFRGFPHILSGGWKVNENVVAHAGWDCHEEHSGYTKYKSSTEIQEVMYLGC